MKFIPFPTFLKGILVVLLTGIYALSYGQSDAPDPTLNSPYNTIYVHLYYLQPDSYDPSIASQTLYGVQDSAKADRLAIKLKQIFDGKGLYIKLNMLPQEPDYRDTTTNRFFYTPFPDKAPDIYLERINGKWYYSAETVDAIPDLHKDVYPFGTDLLINLIPKAGHQKFLGLALWQYLGIAIVLLVLFLLQFILSRLLRPLVKKLSATALTKTQFIDSKLVRTIARLLSALVLIRLLKLFLPSLQLPILLMKYLIQFIEVATVIIVAIIGLRIADVFVKYARKITETTESKMDEQLMPIIQRIVQFVIVLAAIVQVLRIMNVNFTALIAGISIGGLALALAAQDTVKNLIGSATIFVDKPFQIGDWINFNDIHGTVEEVGFRSTKVRTFANSLVYVPNGKLADTTINNYGLRIYRRFNTDITITYQTPPYLIEAFVEGIKGIVQKHPDTRKDAYYVYLNSMGASSLNVLLYMFFDTPTYDKELKGKHEILLAIIQLAHTLGVQFAFPSSSIYVETMPGTNGNGSSPAPLPANTEDANKAVSGFLDQFEQQMKSNEQ